MDPARGEAGSSLVLHILPEDMARGAQAYARALVDRLDEPDQPHRLVTLFRTDYRVVKPDFRLDVPTGRLRSAGFHPTVVSRLRALLNEVEPAVLVAHGGEAAKYAALVKGRGVPLIYLMIGASHPRLSRSLSAALYRWTLRRCSRVVAVSRQLADEAARLHGVARERIVVIPNGRDAAEFRPAANEEAAAAAVRVAWVGHMDEAKRPDRYLDVIASLSERDVPVEAWMAGDGPLFGSVSRKASEIGVEVLGARDDIPDLLAESDLLVFTGRPPEGMPGVLIEAGLSGLPVVTTRVPGAEDVVEHGVTGLIVDVDSFDDLLEAVVSLTNDEDRRSRMGAAARDRCVRRFSLEHTAGEWRSVIAEVKEAA